MMIIRTRREKSENDIYPIFFFFNVGNIFLKSINLSDFLFEIFGNGSLNCPIFLAGGFQLNCIFFSLRFLTLAIALCKANIKVSQCLALLHQPPARSPFQQKKEFQKKERTRFEGEKLEENVKTSGLYQPEKPQLCAGLSRKYL